MGIVVDPALYRASEKDFAPYPIPAWAKSPWQTWHTDMMFDNGYVATAMFSITGLLYTVLLQIVDDKHEIVESSMIFYEKDECSWDPSGYDIHFGSNFFRAAFPRLTLHVNNRETDCGLDIQVDALIEPILSEMPYGLGVGRIKTPSMPIQIAWYMMPWNKLTGTLTVKGKSFSVSGHGWSDHQFGTDDFFTKACHYFYWGNFPLGKHVLTYFEAQGGAPQGYRDIKWLWHFKDGQIHSYDKTAEVYVFTDGIEEGDTVPKDVKYVLEGSRVRGLITGKWKYLVQKQPINCPPLSAMLNRSVYAVHADVTIDGERVVADFDRILEFAFTLEPEPGAAPETEEVPAAAVTVLPVKESAPAAEEELPIGRLNINCKLREVIKDPEGNAVLEKYLPGITNDSNTKLGYGLKLKLLFSMPQTGVSKATLAEMDKDLRRIK